MMPQLKDLLQTHLSAMDTSARAFAERSGISYPTVLALLHKGSVPRKPAHREALRRELNLAQDDWAAVLAASQRDGIDIPSDGPLSLRQMILKALFAQGFTEQTFAKVSGVPYATLMGMTRKGAIPRAETLQVIADKLGLDRVEVTTAVQRSRVERAHDGLDGGSEVILLASEEPPEEAANATINGHAPEEEETAPPFLSQLAANRIAEEAVSVAGFARSHGIPYISLHHLLTTGIPPQRESVLVPLAKALGLNEDDFTRSLRRSTEIPTPATHPQDDDASTPLQDSLRDLVKSRNLTTKAFAELADLSVLTATKLLKHGDLPGRVSTHEKLRSLLQLEAGDYQELVRRSRPEIPVRSGAGDASLQDAPSIEELMELVRRLGPRQRSALKRFILDLA
jgi:predicted transcriptional regulator